MAVKKVTVAAAVSKAEAPIAEEAKEITGIWSQEPVDASSSTKQKVLFKGKERIVHWEQHPSNPALDVGWVRVCCEEAYKGPCTLSDVLTLKKRYPESRGFLVEDNVSFNRHNVCVYNKVVVLTRKHVEE